MCFDDPTLVRFMDGRLSENEHDAVSEHVRSCDRCRSRATELAMQGQFVTNVPQPEASPQQSSLDEQASFQTGDTVASRYLLAHTLGRGGQSVVFEAIDTRINEIVALKVFELPTQSRLREAEREMSSASRIASPFVVRIRDHLIDRSREILVMERVEGRALSQLIAERSLTLARARNITRDLLQGLVAIHAAHVVHRDLKPSNVIVQENDRVIIIDFGVAKDAQRVTQSASTVFVGTPIYWAPELSAGRKATVASDLYALGRIALDMVESVRDGSDRTFRAWIERCLHPFPEGRFESAQVALDALDGSSRRRAAWIAAGVVGVGALGIGGWLALSAPTSQVPPPAPAPLVVPDASVVATELPDAASPPAILPPTHTEIAPLDASVFDASRADRPPTKHYNLRHPARPNDVDDVVIERHPRVRATD